MAASFGWLGRFARSEDGSATIEAVLWLPMFFALVVLITDGSLAFHGRAQAFRLVHDANRAFATGRLASTEATQAWIRRSIQPLAPNATVRTVVNADRTVVASRVTIPVSDLALFSMFEGFDLVVQSEHYVE